MHRTLLPVVLTALTVVLTACEQSSQGLPFEPDPTHISERSIGTSGGLISHPVGISIEFPPGALARAAQISVSVETDLSKFPGSPEGTLIPGTFFRVSPAALSLTKPVSVNVAVRADSLDSEDLLRLGFATERIDARVTTEGVSFDLTSGILHGQLQSLGAMAAIVSDNAVSVVPENPPALRGGGFAPAGVSRPSGAAALPETTTTGAFRARCGHVGEIRRCLGSGTIELWASSEIRDRLSTGMVLLNPDVDGTLEFTDFVNGVPTKAIGTLDVQGTLRVQLGQAITSFEVDDVFVTNGPGGASAVTIDGASIVLHSTSTGQRTIEYEVRSVGTGEQLIVRGQRTVEFDNADGTTTSATLFIDVRLRR